VAAVVAAATDKIRDIKAVLSSPALTCPSASVLGLADVAPSTGESRDAAADAQAWDGSVSRVGRDSGGSAGVSLGVRGLLEDLSERRADKRPESEVGRRKLEGDEGVRGSGSEVARSRLSSKLSKLSSTCG